MSQSKSTRLTLNQRQKIMTYPTYWQGTLLEAVQPGESIDEVYEELKAFEDMI